MIASRGARLKEASLATLTRKGLNGDVSEVPARSTQTSGSTPRAWDVEEVEASSAQSEGSSGPVSARSGGLSAEERDSVCEGRLGRSLTREDEGRSASSKDRRTAVSPFRSLPDLHPHEVELRVAVKDLSREVAPEKFRSKTKGVGGFVFGLLVFPQGTKSAPEHAKKNRPSKDSSSENREEAKSGAVEVVEEKKEEKEEPLTTKSKKETRWISAFVEARPSEDYPPHWFFEDVQFLVSLINFEDLKKSIVKHDKHTFSPVESSDGKAIDRGWHDFVHCDEATLRNNGFVDPKDDTVCFRASVYLAGGAMRVSPKTKSRYMSLSKIELSGPYEKVPNFLSSLVQLWYHIGHFRGVVYSAPAVAGNSASASANGSKRGSCVLNALREVFIRLQARSPPASCSALCAAFGRRMWARICEAEPDAFCLEVFRAMEAELTTDLSKADGGSGGNKKDGKNAKAKAISAKVDQMTHDQRMMWEAMRELFEFEVEWTAQSIEGGDFSDNSIFQGPVFTFVVRGFSSLENALDHYFSPKIIEDGSGLRVRTNRRFRRLPMVLQWYLKRGDYDCCTGLCGLTDTFLAFPRHLDMSKYCEPSCRSAEGCASYILYGVMVESDDHYWSYIRPEMEGDQGQWYRFDDRESATCAMSNATAIDASFGGEEWLCVNYLYGPSAVLTRPKESRACLLVYLRESSMDVLLNEPRLPKISKEIQSASLQRESQLREAPGKAIEAEAAAAAAQALLEEVEQQAQKEERKRKQKQKKKQKEKEKKSQAKVQATLSDSPGEDRKSEGKASPEEGLSEDEFMSTPILETPQKEVLASLGGGNKKKLGGRASGREKDALKDSLHSRREPSVDSCGSNGFEEQRRMRARWRSKVDDNSVLKDPGEEAPLVDSLCSKEAWLEAHRSNDKPRRRGARSPGRSLRDNVSTSTTTTPGSSGATTESSRTTAGSTPGSRGTGSKDTGGDLSQREQRRAGASGSISAPETIESATSLSNSLGLGSSAGSSGTTSGTNNHDRSSASSSHGKKATDNRSSIGSREGSSTGGPQQLGEAMPKASSSPSKPARSGTANQERCSPTAIGSGNRAGVEGGGRAVSSKASPTTPGESRPNGTEAHSPADRSELGSWKDPVSPAKAHPKALVADGRANVTGLPKASPSKPKQRGEAPIISEPPEAMASRASPSSSSRSPGRRSSPVSSNSLGLAVDDAANLVRVFPQQLVTQDVGGALGEYAQFVCKICHLVVRSPLVLPCAHMFCSKCFDQWVQQKRPNVECPTCKQDVRPQDVKHFESRSSSTSNGPASGGALGLLYRLYSGMKVRCVYHPELLGAGTHLTKEAERASGSSLSCNWRGAMHDYQNHLLSCEVHAAVAATTCTPASASSPGLRGNKASGRQAVNSRGQAAPLGAVPVSPPMRGEPAPLSKASSLSMALPPQALPTTPAASSRSGYGWAHTQLTGAFQVLAPWRSPEAGALCVQQGATLWVNSTDESGEWAYARLLVPPTPSAASVGADNPSLHAWVPVAVLQRAVYPACSLFDANGQAQGLSLHLGDFVHVYHREASGWTYGARLERHCSNPAAVGSTVSAEEVGWFPEACIMDPLPVS